MSRPNQDQCKSLCTSDSGCKGYAIAMNGKCQLATTSECPYSHPFAGPYDAENVGALDIAATCLVGNWDIACMIKEGIILYHKIFHKLVSGPKAKTAWGETNTLSQS